MNNVVVVVDVFVLVNPSMKKDKDVKKDWFLFLSPLSFLPFPRRKGVIRRKGCLCVVLSGFSLLLLLLFFSFSTLACQMKERF